MHPPIARRNPIKPKSSLRDKFKEKRIQIHFDGACKNKQDFNCPMGLGIAVFEEGEYQEDMSRAILIEDHHTDGTSNIAEWMAVVEAMKIAASIRKTFDGKIVIVGDSQLICNQFNGLWQIKDEKFREYYNQAKQFDQIAKVGELLWMARENNTKADELSKLALKQSKISSKRYTIMGRHDDAESDWLEFENDDVDVIMRRYSFLCFDNGEEYTIWDHVENKEIYYTEKF